MPHPDQHRHHDHRTEEVEEDRNDSHGPELVHDLYEHGREDDERREHGGYGEQYPPPDHLPIS